MKWFWIILLIVVGIVAAVFAYEYLTVGIGHLPSWVPGHVAAKPAINGKCPNGHTPKDGLCYAAGHAKKRGYLCVLIAVAAFAGAGWMIWKDRTSGNTGTPAAA